MDRLPMARNLVDAAECEGQVWRATPPATVSVLQERWWLAMASSSRRVVKQPAWLLSSTIPGSIWC
jgi:hypothetical protein